VGRTREHRQLGCAAARLEDPRRRRHPHLHFPSFTLGPGAKVKLHTGSGSDSATDLYWGQGSHVWNNTGTENAYLLAGNGAEITKKSCR